MEISKSTPYVRYRENISSSLHKGTVHIESEYLDRERKTTIESIEGQTWQNLAVNENKELEMLGVGSIGLSGDIYDTGEKRLAVDVVMGNATPTVNEDGTYTYSVSTMEGEYARTFDGVNHITSTSDGLDGEFHIKYNTQGEEIVGNFSMNGGELHTIDNSKNGEVTSAILKGNTLVNLISNNTISVNGGESNWKSYGYLSYTLTSGEKYLIKAKFTENTINHENGVTLLFRQLASNGSTQYVPIKNLIKNGYMIVTIDSDKPSIDNISIYANSNATSGSLTLKDLLIMKYQEGMENWDIPYFEGMQSVKNPSIKTIGKNLFNGRQIAKKLSTYGVAYEDGMLHLPKPTHGNTYTQVHLMKGEFKSNAQYTLSLNKAVITEPNADWSIHPSFIYTDGTKSGAYLKEGKSVVSSANKTIDHIEFNNPWSVGGKYIFQLEEGSVATSYEHHKSNILTVNEEVELRGIGDVKDTLDLTTGELTQRIGEIVLDGSEEWTPYHGYVGEGNSSFVATITSLNNKHNDNVNSIINDKFISSSWISYAENPNIETVWSHDPNKIGIRVKSERASDVAGIKAFLSANNIKINYELATPVVKTVDLTIKDQDGKTSRQLSTYEGTTHVNVSSNGLIPLADISYKMYSTTDVVSGTSATIEDGKDSDMVEGVVYGATKYFDGVDILDSYTPWSIKDKMIPNRMINSTNGLVSSSSTESATEELLPVPSLTPFKVCGNVTWKKIVFYDKNGEHLKGKYTENTTTDLILNESDIPSSSKYVRFSYSSLTPIDVVIKDLDDNVITYPDIRLISVENPLVTVCGKNLLNPEILMLGSSLDGTNTQGNYRHSIFIPIEPDTKYCFRYMDFIHWYDNAKNQIGDKSQGWGAEYRIYTSPSNAKYVRVTINHANFPNEHKSQPSWFLCSIIKSDVNIYEPYYGAHLTTSPQITLHGIGNVKDEWDMVNETVTRRIGEVLLDGETTKVTHFRDVGSDYATFRFHYPHKNPTNRICDKLPDIYSGWTTEKESVSWYINNEGFITLLKSKLGGNSSELANAYLSNHPVRILYLSNEMIPTTESVRITPQNPKTSTASITINEPLNAMDAIHDKLRWNPYKGCYVRYNHIVDGVAYNQHRTIENLYDLGERQCVDLYEHRTYFLPTNGSIESRTHGTSIYCLAEQGKQYCVRWDWIEAPTVDTIKVDLCGNTKIIPSTETSVVIDATHVQHNFVQLQGNGLQGRFTNLMVIETVDGEIPDVDFFSGVKAIGNTVQVDGVTKVQIDVEQTNGNLLDTDFTIYNNGNNIDTNLLTIKPNKTYRIKCAEVGRSAGVSWVLKDKDKKETNRATMAYKDVVGDGGLVMTSSNDKYLQMYRQTSENGSANIHSIIEVSYADMAKDSIRPRYHDMKSFILPMKLCRVGEVYDSLYYDDLKGYYRIQQSIGHKYFTGDASERWEMGAINLNSRTVAFTYKNGDINQLAMGDTICNGFKRLKDVNQDMEGFIIYNGDFVLRIDKERIEGNCSIDGLRAYLTSYPIHLFYQLKTPQMVDLSQYPNRLELNTYRDEVFTFIKDSNPTRFTLSVPMDRTYRFDDHQEGQGLANRVSITDERISSENVVAIQEIRGKGIANLIEDPNNVPITPLPNYSGVATSHQLTNTKPSIVHVHGFEPSGDTKIGTWNVADKKYQIKVMSGNNNYSLSDYYVLDVPYQLETYPDGTKDRVYYNEEHQEWQVNGSYDRTIAFNASTGAFTEAVEIFRGMTPRSGMIAEFKLRFTSGTTTARLYYSVNGSTYSYVTLRGMVDDQDYYLAFFNTGGTKIDYSTKVGATTEYASMTALSATIPEGLFVNQIQSITECTHYVDKFYQYPTLHTPIELDTYDGTTNIYIDGKTTDTNIIINNDCFQKVVNTYEDVEYTVYWKYLSGDGKLTITLGGTRVEVDGTKEYATIRTQLQASQELVYIGGYNLSIQDVMVVKGARIDGLAYFEGSRQVGTLAVDEHGNKQYKITLVQGGSVLEQRDYDKVEFKDDNKHNVVVHKIVGVRPTKVD